MSQPFPGATLVTIPFTLPVTGSYDPTIAVWCNYRGRVGESGTTYLIDMASTPGLDENIVDVFMQVNDCRKGKLIAMVSPTQVRHGTVYSLAECISAWHMSTHVLAKLKQGTRGIAAKLHPYDNITALLIRQWCGSVTQKVGCYMWRTLTPQQNKDAGKAANQAFYELYGYRPEPSLMP